MIKKEYALKALSIDSESPEVNSTLGLQILRDGNPELSFYYFKKALQINPNNPIALQLTGLFYNAMGLFQQSDLFYLKALETKLGQLIEVSEKTQVTGAIGAALIAQKA